MDIIKKIRETIAQYSMLSIGDLVLIGLSGGPDSIFLSVILNKLKNDFDLSLSAVYIDHGLRPEEAKKEMKFCRKFCDDNQIKFYTKKASIKNYAKDKCISVQEAAREIRYQVYDEVSKEINASRIALGHNADDQAETVLMRLLRGSGRKGLAGIPPVRGNIIRPLIEIERSEIERFLTGNVSQSYMSDSSNLREDYFRNWIRLSFMKEIKKRNPAVIQDICRTAHIFREEDEYLEFIVTKTLIRLISRKSDASIELFLSPLEIVEKPILRRILRRAIDATEGLRDIRYGHIEAIITLIKHGTSGDRIHLPKGIRVVKEYSLLKVTKEGPLTLSEYEVQPPCEITIKELNVVLKASFLEKCGESGDGRRSIILDAGVMNYPLGIRSRSKGDFFYPLGFGRKKKLQDFFVDEKIPRDERDRIPIVVSGNDIIWVAGHRADERFKVTGKTEKFLRLMITKL